MQEKAVKDKRRVEGRIKAVHEGKKYFHVDFPLLQDQSNWRKQYHAGLRDMARRLNARPCLFERIQIDAAQKTPSKKKK
jgi:hypothetical protein